MNRKALVVLSFLIATGVASPVLAQGQTPREFPARKFEITPQVGYLTGNSFVTGVGTAEIPGELDYGVTVDFTVKRGIQFEVIYRRTDTKLRLRSGGIGAVEDIFDMSINHFLAGFLVEFEEGSRLRPFINLGGGMVHYAPDDAAVSSETRLALNLGCGLKVFLSDNVGLRLSAAMWPTVDWIGGGIFCGGGCGGTVSASSSVVHFDLSAGVIIGF